MNKIIFDAATLLSMVMSATAQLPDYRQPAKLKIPVYNYGASSGNDVALSASAEHTMNIWMA